MQAHPRTSGALRLAVTALDLMLYTCRIVSRTLKAVMVVLDSGTRSLLIEMAEGGASARPRLPRWHAASQLRPMGSWRQRRSANRSTKYSHHLVSKARALQQIRVHMGQYVLRAGQQYSGLPG